jgi:hypothetical protein
MDVQKILEKYDKKEEKREKNLSLWEKKHNEKLVRKLITMWVHGKRKIAKNSSLGISLDLRDDSVDKSLNLYDFRIIEEKDFFQIVRR